MWHPDPKERPGMREVLDRLIEIEQKCFATPSVLTDLGIPHSPIYGPRLQPPAPSHDPLGATQTEDPHPTASPSIPAETVSHLDGTVPQPATEQQQQPKRENGGAEGVQGEPAGPNRLSSSANARIKKISLGTEAAFLSPVGHPSSGWGLCRHRRRRRDRPSSWGRGGLSLQTVASGEPGPDSSPQLFANAH